MSAPVQMTYAQAAALALSQAMARDPNVIALGEDLTPMLSTIAQPNADIGRQSVELLAKAMGSNSVLTAQSSITLAHHFRKGESCAQAPTGSKKAKDPASRAATRMP